MTKKDHQCKNRPEKKTLWQKSLLPLAVPNSTCQESKSDTDEEIQETEQEDRIVRDECHAQRPVRPPSEEGAVKYHRSKRRKNKRKHDKEFACDLKGQKLE